MACIRGHVQDLANVGHESEVGHAVGFVDHADLHGAQIAVALLDDVDETSRRRDHDRRTLAERVNLRAERSTTVDGLYEAPLGPAECDEHFLDLLGEFTGGHEHQTGGLVRGGLADSHHHRNTESEGLARTRGRAPAKVLAGKGVGEGDGLNRERFGDAISGECFYQARGDAKICK